MFASTKAVEAALCADCPTPQSKLLLAIIGGYCDPRLQAFPSLNTLRERSGIKSESGLRDQLKLLVNAGLLRIETDRALNGRQTSNVYTVLVPVPGCTPAPPMDRPRRSHPHSVRRPVEKPVGKLVNKPADTPRDTGGHPPQSGGTYPPQSGGLEQNQINKNACATPEGPKPGAVQDAKPWKGKRYTAPAAPVAKVRRASDDEAAARGLSELAATLHGLARSRV